MEKPEKVDKWESKHVIRAPDPLWDAFGDACADAGQTRSGAIRAYMRRYVAAWKGRQPKGDHDASSCD